MPAKVCRGFPWGNGRIHLRLFGVPMKSRRFTPKTGTDKNSVPVAVFGGSKKKPDFSVISARSLTENFDYEKRLQSRLYF